LQESEYIIPRTIIDASKNFINKSTCKEDPVNPIDEFIYFENINPPLRIKIKTVIGNIFLALLEIEFLISMTVFLSKSLCNTGSITTSENTKPKKNIAANRCITTAKLYPSMFFLFYLDYIQKQ